MFFLKRGWETIMIYGVDHVNDKFLIYEYGQWEWVPMDAFEPLDLK